MYVAINNFRGVRKYGISSIKACISGSAPLPVEVQEAFEKLTKGKLVEGYGLTEASPITHANPLGKNRRIGTIGVPLPSTQAAVVDLKTSSKEVAPGQIGELAIRGPQVMMGYWKDEAATKALVTAARSDKPLLKAVSLWALARENPENLEVVEYAAKAMAAGLTSEDAELRTVAAKLLSHFGSHPEIVGPTLVAALQDLDPRVVGNALDALAAFGPKILPRVTGALKDPQRRHLAVALIYRLGPEAAPAVPAMIEASTSRPQVTTIGCFATGLSSFWLLSGRRPRTPCRS